MSEDITANLPPKSPPFRETEPPPAVPVLESAALTNDEKLWAMFCHLSALIGAALGGFTFLGPLICWLLKKDESAFVDRHGKESLNFQLNMFLWILVCVAAGFITCGVTWALAGANGIYAIIMPIVAGLKANEGQEYVYPLTIRIIH